MNTTRREFIKRTTLAALTAAGMGPLSLIEAGCAQTAKRIVDKNATLGAGWRNSYQSQLDPVNQAPYIAAYYIAPKVLLGKDVVISYYVTDYEQREYANDDFSATFTIDYWVNGVKSTIKDVKTGDNSFTLKSPPKGEVLFALQATDAQGRKSHRFFQQFIVVDPAEEAIPEAKIYHPDLKKFGISNEDTNPAETTKGLTEMLKWAVDNGYRKVILPKGRYRIDADSAVLMASGLTLDMNGATFKSNPNLRDKAIMLDMVDCIDSHVINGTFEGDLKERDFENSPKNTEWVNAVHIGRGSRYCSYEDLKVIDVVGRGTNTSMTGFGVGPGGKSYVGTRVRKTGEFTPGDIDDKGNFVASTVRLSTEEMADVSQFQEPHGFFQLGLYLGYQGNPTGSWVYQAHFYDANKKFLETIEGYLYRRLHLPKEAKFARFTVVPRPERAEKIQKLMLFDFLMPYNCTFRNIHHENNRCIGMTPSGFVNLLVEGCTFENCGWAAAKCAFDAEDGWDMAQDLTFRNNTFGKNPRNEFVCISGHNFVVENNVMGAYLRNRSFTVRNNKLKTANFQFGDRRSSGWPRVYENIIEGNTRLTTKGKFEGSYREFRIRDNVLRGGVGAPRPKTGEVVPYVYKCKIEGGSISAKVVQCELKNIKNTGGLFEIYESEIEDSELKISGVTSRSVIKRSTIKNTQVQNLNSRMLLQDNTILDTTFGTASGWIETLEYVFTGNKITTSKDYLITMNNSFKQILFEANTVTAPNPNFNGIVLLNPQAKKSKELMVAATKSTFTGKGQNVINVVRPPAVGTLLTIYAKGNTYTGLKAINDKAFDMKTVKLLEQEPPTV